jgi:hypothetical protein
MHGLEEVPKMGFYLPARAMAGSVHGTATVHSKTKMTLPFGFLARRLGRFTNASGIHACLHDAGKCPFATKHHSRRPTPCQKWLPKQTAKTGSLSVPLNVIGDCFPFSSCLNDIFSILLAFSVF